MRAEAWIALLTLAVIASWCYACFAGLRARRRRITAVYAQVDGPLRRRHALVPQLVAAARATLGPAAASLLALERSHAAAVQAAATVRCCPVDADAVGVLAAAEQALEQALERLRAVAGVHAQLDSDGVVQSLGQALVLTGTQLEAARQAFDDEVLEYNEEAALFPAAAVARLAGFLPAAPLVPAARPQAASAAA